MSVGEIATWVFLDWKGRALSKLGVVYGTLVFRTESVDGKQRKGFYVVSYSDQWVMNLASRWSYFCTYLHAIQCWSENFLLWMGEGWGGEIRTCTSCCLRVMKTVKQSSKNQNSCKYLREALTIWWLEEQYLERCMVVELTPSKHKGVASGPKIVFARSGLARLLGYGYGVINLSLIHIWRCRRIERCRSRWSPYH